MSATNGEPSKLMYLLKHAAKGAFHGLWLSFIVSIVVACLGNIVLGIIFFPFIAGFAIVVGATLMTLFSLLNLPRSQNANRPFQDELGETLEEAPKDIESKLDILKRFNSR